MNTPSFKGGTMKAILLVLLLSAATLNAADVTGRWSGTMDLKNAEGATGSGPTYIILKQEGSKVTGTGGPNENEQYPIQNGKLEGDKLTFESVTGGNTMYFDLRVKGDQIDGDIKGGEGGKLTAKISVKRVAAK
jgi:hypothetical protein